MKNQSKLLIKRVVVLLKYRFFEMRERLEGNQVRVEEIAKLSQSKDSLAMLKGLVLGEKITQNTYYAVFQRVGLLHILVASGFNVALLTGLVTKKNVFFSRKTKSLVSLVIIWLYVWFLEGDPPLLRAGVMLSLLILANQVGRAISSRRVLIYSVFILLFFNLELIKSLSFWFSVLATLGLILFSGQFLLFSSGELTITSFFRQEFLASVSAQILLLPLVIWFFGELNWLSFISNSLFLFPVAWFTQVGFVLGGLLAWFKNSYLELLFWPYLLIYRYVIASFISLVGQLRFLFFLRQTVLPEEKDFYLLVWGMGLLVLIVFLRRKHNRKVVFFHENC
ncbi:MAG: ComEC/Rec2 family competence protein [Patescibacteria group bacterium]